VVNRNQDNRPEAGTRDSREIGLVAAAYSVHLLTATGAALGFLALLAAQRGDIRMAFVWLGVALVVDAIDGPLARRVSTSSRAPRYSGDTLDLVVDYLNYVLVPAVIIMASGLLPANSRELCGVMILTGSALYFADTEMKTRDLWFRGFPAVWNVVAFHLIVFEPAPWVAFGTIVLGTVGMFLPIAFVHPVRVKRFRAATLLMLAIWSAAALHALASDLRPPTAIRSVLLACIFYFLAIGLSKGLIRDDDRRSI
jgi:phosphatidylcholine synthase